MQIDFSKEAFDTTDNPEALRLRLAEEISHRVYSAVSRELEAIANELRTLGHDTQSTAKYNSEFAAWQWSAEHSNETSGERRLRFYHDSQVSCWYD